MDISESSGFRGSQQGHEGVSACCASNDGKWLLSVGRGILRLWNNDDKLRGGQGRAASSARKLSAAANAFSTKPGMKAALLMKKKASGIGGSSQGILVRTWSYAGEGFVNESGEAVKGAPKLPPASASAIPSCSFSADDKYLFVLTEYSQLHIFRRCSEADTPVAK